MKFYYSKRKVIDREMNEQNKKRVEKAFNQLLTEKEDADILSWMNIPILNNTEEYSEVFELAEEIKETSEILVVLGLLEGILPLESFIHSFSNDIEEKPEIYFFSNVNTMMDLNLLIEELKEKDFSLFYFDRLGDNEKLEATYEILRGLLEIKYDKRQAGERTFLYGENEFFAEKKTNERIRFYKKNKNSFLYTIFDTPMLLPLIVDGVNVSKVLDGALTARNKYLKTSLENNDLFEYILYKENIKKEADIHFILSYIPKFTDNLDYLERLLQENSSLNHLQMALKDPKVLEDKMAKKEVDQDLSILVLNLEKAKKDISIPGDFEETYFQLEKRLQNELMDSLEEYFPLVNISIEKREEDVYGQLYYFAQAVSLISAYLKKID